MAKAKDEVMTDNTKWVMFDKFLGYVTNKDAQKIEDPQSPYAINVSMNEGDRLSLRNKGYEKLGDLSSFGTTDPITSMHTFRKRDGSAVLMATFGTYMVYYNTASETWEMLKNNFTANKVFGFADYTLHTDLSSQCYFGNSVDNFSRWTGTFSKLTNAVGIGDTLITLDSIAGFPINGSAAIGNNIYTYSMYGGVTGVTVGNVGTGYSVNDVLTVVQAGGAGCTLTVTSINGTGGITGITITTPGTGYHGQQSLATTVAPPGGTNATVDITGINSSSTITITGGTALEVVAAGRGVAEAIWSSGLSTYPKGNIYLVANNRLFISGVLTSPQAVYFSKYGDPTDFTSTALVTGSTSTASGTFNLAEGGGSVSGLGFFEGSIYAFKRTMVYKITLSDTLYVLQQIKPFDGKSQTIGGIANKCIFTGSNYVFFITPDKQIMSLERVEYIDYPQNVPISRPIYNTFKKGSHDSAAGIAFGDLAFFSTKSNMDSSVNDIVYVWNMDEKFWDGTITGWNASDFSVYGNDGVEDLYFGSSNSTNIYKLNDSNLDDIYGIKGTWRSKQFTFGAPQTQKIMTDMFIEGYITPTTNLKITLYLDDEGFTKKVSTILKGTETDFLFSQGEFNMFGINPFGIETFGSNDDFTWLTKFRIYLNKNFRLAPFYNCQLEFESDGDNQDWEIIQYGFKVGAYTKTENRKLFKTFS